MESSRSSYPTSFGELTWYSGNDDRSHLGVTAAQWHDSQHRYAELPVKLPVALPAMMTTLKIRECPVANGVGWKRRYGADAPRDVWFRDEVSGFQQRQHGLGISFSGNAVSLGAENGGRLPRIALGPTGGRLCPASAD